MAVQWWKWLHIDLNSVVSNLMNCLHANSYRFRMHADKTVTQCVWINYFFTKYSQSVACRWRDWRHDDRDTSSMVVGTINNASRAIHLNEIERENLIFNLYKSFAIVRIYDYWTTLHLCASYIFHTSVERNENVDDERNNQIKSYLI